MTTKVACFCRLLKCTQYSKAKEQLVKHFKENSFGQWVKKPVEQDMFTVDSGAS